MIIEEETYLEHFGVRGMKWGVRRARRVQALTRASKKNSELSSKLRGLQNVGPVDLVKGKGLTGATARKAKRVGGQLKRFDQGKATTSDLLKRYGSTRVADLIPVRTKNINKKTTVRSDRAVVAARGALVVANLLSGGFAGGMVFRV